ncbi:MAG: MFS transporter [Fibrobacteria bacterium]|nr:MFS transporter [Fibrobacteria bacterium]
MASADKTSSSNPLASLWHAGTPNFRVLALTGILWTVPLALTEPYRFLFCHRLGLSESTLGLLLSADLVIRSLGLLLSGWFLRRFGAKRMLILADVLSWVVPYLLFATASTGIQAGFGLVLMSVNAFASTPYLCLLAEGALPATRTRAFAFLNICNILPGAILPWISADLTQSHDVVSVLRWLFLFQAVLMGAGIAFRGSILEDLGSQSAAEKTQPNLVKTLRRMLHSPAFRRIWPFLLLQGASNAVWNAWSAIHFTGPLGLPDGAPGWNAQTTAITLTFSAFLILPRIPERKVSQAMGIASIVSLFAGLLYLTRPGLPLLLGIGAIQGLANGILLSATSSHLAASLPRRARDHGFALSFVGVHLGVAVFMGLGSRILAEAPNRFLFMFLGIAALQAIAGVTLLRPARWWRRTRPPQAPPLVA